MIKVIVQVDPGNNDAPQVLAEAEQAASLAMAIRSTEGANVTVQVVGNHPEVGALIAYLRNALGEERIPVQQALMTLTTPTTMVFTQAEADRGGANVIYGSGGHVVHYFSDCTAARGGDVMLLTMGTHHPHNICRACLARFERSSTLPAAHGAARLW